MNAFQTIVSRFRRKQLPDDDGLSVKIKLLKIWIYSEFRVGRRAGGETGCYLYENVARMPMWPPDTPISYAPAGTSINSWI